MAAGFILYICIAVKRRAFRESRAWRTVAPMIRLGLCCIFREEPIAFRRTTATALAGLSKRERLARLADLPGGNEIERRCSPAAARSSGGTG
jgi:hypothetical protein